MKLTTKSVMKQLDQWTNNHSWWAKGYVPANRVWAGIWPYKKDSPIKITPAIQQVRAEIEELVDVIIKRKLTGGTILEIGMGITGGTHFLWNLLAKRVVTVELYRERIDKFITKKPIVCKNQIFINGRSEDPLIISQATFCADQCDVLFIDGDHSYEAVKRDYENYSHLVKKGGLIVFHDTISNGGYGSSMEVKRYIDYNFFGVPKNHIHKSKCVGITYMVKD